jgi:hypothetical protein
VVEAVRDMHVNEYIHLITINNSIFYTLKNSTYLAMKKTMEREKDDELNNRKLNNKILLRALSELNNNGLIITI